MNPSVAFSVERTVSGAPKALASPNFSFCSSVETHSGSFDSFLIALS
jgi:hypothetical protein